MAPLTTKRRKELPAKEFALSGGRYPIDTEARARDALSRGAANATPEELAEIRRKVHEKYPDMQIEGMRHGRGKAAKNKTPAEAYAGEPKRSRSEERRHAEMKKAPRKKESVADRLTRQNVL